MWPSFQRDLTKYQPVHLVESELGRFPCFSASLTRALRRFKPRPAQNLALFFCRDSASSFIKPLAAPQEIPYSARPKTFPRCGRGNLSFNCFATPLLRAQPFQETPFKTLSVPYPLAPLHRIRIPTSRGVRRHPGAPDGSKHFDVTPQTQHKGSLSEKSTAYFANMKLYNRMLYYKIAFTPFQ